MWWVKLCMVDVSGGVSSPHICVSTVNSSFFYEILPYVRLIENLSYFPNFVHISSYWRLEAEFLLIFTFAKRHAFGYAIIGVLVQYGQQWWVNCFKNQPDCTFLNHQIICKQIVEYVKISKVHKSWPAGFMNWSSISDTDLYVHIQVKQNVQINKSPTNDL